MEPLSPPPPTPTIKPTDLNITTTPTTATIPTDKTSPVSPTSLPPPSPPPNTPTNPVPPPIRIPTPPSPDSLRATASLYLRTKRAVLRRSILLKPDFKNPDGGLQNIWAHRVKALDTDAEGVLRDSVTTCGRRNTNFASEEEMRGRRKGRGRSGLGAEVKGLVPGGVEEGRRRVGGDWGEEMESEDMQGLERTGEEGKGDGKTEAWWKFGT